MDVDVPSTVDADHRATVAKALSEQNPGNLSDMHNCLSATVRAANSERSRDRKLSQIGVESLIRLYTEAPGPTEDPE